MSKTTPRALNLRIASLDPNTPKAKKDCKTCNRRRIRCDRSLPTCQKCGIRQLDCPGYDLKLKWDQGVASRGRLAGKALPIFEREEVPHASRSRRNVKENDDVWGPLVVPEIKYEIVDPRGNAFDDLDRESTVERVQFVSLPTFRLDIPTTLSMHPELQKQGMNELVHHYDHNLAATLVWVDSCNNPWRNVILPLAYEEPLLLFSVLALAAEHRSKRAPDDSLQRIKLQTDACRFRDKSLKLLANHLKQEMQGRYDGHYEGKDDLSKTTSTKTILATMLMLCQLEMVHSESLVWKIHLQASHTMIQSWLLTPSRFDMGDADNKFLIKETFTINVFAASSSFTDDEEALAFEDADEHTLFSGFMTAIHEITRHERRIASGKAKVLPELPLLEQRLDHARTSTQQLAASYDKLQPKAIRLNFDRVVDIYHHAGIVYAYQALAAPEIARQAIDPQLDLLLEALHLLPASGLFAQDLAWPLFIASTECRDRKTEQQWLQQKMEDSAEATGFESCYQAWEFLQKWWDQDEDASCYASWIGYARARAKRGHTFLVF